MLVGSGGYLSIFSRNLTFDFLGLLPILVNCPLSLKGSVYLLLYSTLRVTRFTLFFFFNINLFIWLHWVFVAACGLSLVVASGGYSVEVRGLLIAVASLVEEHGL